MRRLLIFITFLLTSTSLMAVSSTTSQSDELRKLLPTLSGEKKLAAYEKLVSLLEWNEDPRIVLQTCDEWIRCAHEEGDLKSEEGARNKKLTLIYNAEDWYRLNDEAKIQKDWMEKNGRWNSFYKAWRDIAESYSYSGRPQTALREAKAMQDHAQKQGNNLGLAFAYQQMGVIYDNIDHEESAKAFERCIDILKDTPELSRNELLSAYFYMAQELDQLGAYERELQTCEQWKAQLKKIESIEGETSGRMDVHYLEYHLWNASALIGLNRLDEAEEELKASEALSEKIKDPYLTYQLQVHRANHALKNNDIQTAMQYSDQFAKVMDIDWWPLAQRLRGDILIKSGRDREAALLYKKMYQHKDSTFSKDVRMQLDELNTLFKVDEIRMKGELERSRLFIAIIILIVLALLIIIYLRQRAAKHLKQKNEELIMANTRAEESSKMKSEFIGQISHEFRTPLNILNGFAQVITTPGIELKDEEKSDIQKRISESTYRITELVNKMLELSDVSSHTVIERTDNAVALQIATEAAEESGVQNSESVSFEMPIEEQAGAVILHTNQAYAVRTLVLLLDNARKFLNKPGGLSEHKKGTVRLYIRQEPSSLAFVVEDTGIGVPPEQAEHIFEEFVQLDNYYEGTGVGLAVARSIARRLGGDVTLDTSYVGGARFIMTLPIE